MNIVEWMRLAIITNNKIFSCNISYYSYTVITIFPMNRGHPTHDRGCLKNMFLYSSKNGIMLHSMEINLSMLLVYLCSYIIYWEKHKFINK